ncbi:hypothetical protein EHQ96_02870 [Leptospira levettii]|uniref:Uncharacterized protein n=1 Tax=Leptospira levettii TaxID=2023178 RepID=A0A2N0B1E7_9LEPT|nr:hypothetical protein [Leptospira levettii]MCG6150144.1 hypothetical protein [Leptospira levettii]MCW7467069.1 hypothetical protein [Leptospira levettii]MCW7475361.1 hypothetical protein [Leptospira levettii]MCW7506281.1 hypothetical protein [Leptospira levettii]MCW7512791.1 hypothetical protein [Leptospira levettii]
MANEKIKYKGTEILENLDQLIQKDYFHFELKGLTKSTRDIVNEVVQGILNRVGANPLTSFHLFSGLMEALLNAVKANTRFVIFQDELLNKLKAQGQTPEEEAEELLDIILETEPLRDAMQRYIVPDKIKKVVQKILTLSDKKRTKKHNLSQDEKDFLTIVREKVKKYDLKISMKIEIRPNSVYIRIRNDSPIMGMDLNRIRKSRERHAELAKQGNSAEFFRPDFLDEKESAGFGIAMIDEGFYNLGLDPLECFDIQTSKKTTTVYLNYPLEALQKMEF